MLLMMNIKYFSNRKGAPRYIDNADEQTIVNNQSWTDKSAKGRSQPDFLSLSTHKWKISWPHKQIWNKWAFVFLWNLAAFWLFDLCFNKPNTKKKKTKNETFFLSIICFVLFFVSSGIFRLRFLSHCSLPRCQDRLAAFAAT